MFERAFTRTEAARPHVAPATPSLVAAALVVAASVVAACALSSCPAPAPVCGNGVVEAGETEATCCADTGCSFGACTANKCVMPWTSTCTAAPGQCDGPYVCAADGAPPGYDCATCGCGAGATCSDGVCFDAITREGARSGDAVADNLSISDYTQLFTDLAAKTPTDILSLSSSIGAAMHKDPRTDVLLFGASPDADLALVRDAIIGHLGIVPAATRAPARVDLDHPADACATVAAAAQVDVLPKTFVVAAVDDDAAAHPTCPYAGSYASCALPLVSDCVVGAGRFAQTVILVDMHVALPILDEELVVRSGFAPPEETGSLLDNGITAFTNAAQLLENRPALALGDRTAGVFATNDVSASFVVLADNAAQPLRLASFRALWSDATAQQYLTSHEIQPRDCTFSFAGEVISIHCEASGNALDATVNESDFALTGVTTSP